MMKIDVSEFDVVLRVKPDLTWTGLIASTVRSYSKSRNYPSRLVDDLIAAVGEAIEQLISLCVGSNISTPFEVGFLWQDEAVQVHLVYDASIPLNPYKEPDYEVPSLGGHSDPSLEGLWLHLIKHTMDRVFFRLDGRKASLVMMKYYREERLARQLWFMGLMPALRADLLIEGLPEEAGQPKTGGAIIHDSRGRAVFRLSPSDLFIVSRLNGKNTLHDIYLEHTVEMGFVSPQQVKQIYERLEAAGMLEDKSGAGEGRRQRWQRWLSPVFSIPRADETVAWVHRHTRFMFHPVAVAILLLVGLSGVIPLYVNRKAIGALLPRLDSVFTDPAMLAVVYAVVFGHVTLHEFAHGATCKHFGGRIGRLGVMWYMAMSIFFCDTTSAWTFPKKSQRIWVSLAGPLVSWALLGVMAWCSGMTAAAASPWALMWTALFIMNAFGLAMNLNPFIRMDAYYILEDWTGIPNLQKKAFDYLLTGITGWIKRNRSTFESSWAVREKRIFVVYGVLSAVVSFLFILLPFWRLANLWMTNRHLTVLGVLISIAVVLIIGNILFKAHGLMYAKRHRQYKIA